MTSDSLLVDLVCLNTSIGMVALGGGTREILGVGIDFYSSFWFLA